MDDSTQPCNSRVNVLKTGIFYLLKMSSYDFVIEADVNRILSRLAKIVVTSPPL